MRATYNLPFQGCWLNSIASRSVCRYVCLFILVSGIDTVSGFAEPPANKIRVELPIVDHRYDARPLASIGVGVGDSLNKGDAVWFPLTTKTRLALTLLKAEGTIANYVISSENLVIEFSREKFNEIKTALFPPHFLNLNDLHAQQRVVVLVHGLEGGALTYRNLAPALEEHGWFPLALIYPNDGSVEEPAAFLRTELVRLHAKHTSTRFVIVAHSLGGLVAWDALTGPEGMPLGVTDLVTLGTPFGGSALAAFQSELEIADVAMRIMAGDWAGRDIGHDGSGEAVDVLLPESSIRKQLLARPLPDNVRLHVVAGDAGPIKTSEQRNFEDAIERLIHKLKPRPAFAKNLRALAIAPELIAGFGDGAVTVESATLVEKYHSKQVFPLSHLGLLLADGTGESNEPSRQQPLVWILSQLDK